MRGLAPVHALRPGQPFATAGGRRGTVVGLLGSGGQGEVHEVLLDGVPVALKWYHRACLEVDVTLRERLSRAIARGAPTHDFLWPLDLVDAPGSANFGYIMPLRAARFRGLRDLIAPPPNRIELTLAQRAAACLRIATCFHELHASGFCYQDINFGNFFIDPAAGEILICDNDNVDVDGAEASIYGTRKFMAPEVVRREALPSSRTDLFSMAVLFFYILLSWHPLDGRREAETAVLDAAAETRLYGADPLFLFHPSDRLNGPVPGIHDWIAAQWETLGPALQSLFVRSFTIGLASPLSRVLESEWRPVLRSVIDTSFDCASCGWQHLASDEDVTRCRGCGERLARPAILRIGRRQWALAAGREIDAASIGAVPRPIGVVEPHPTRPDLLGLRNRGERHWRVQLPEGESCTVEPGRAVRIVPGTSIDLGGTIAQIVAAPEVEVTDAAEVAA